MAKITHAEPKPEIPPPEVTLAELTLAAFNAHIKDNGDMESDVWARRNYLAGFRDGYNLASKVK